MPTSVSVGLRLVMLLLLIMRMLLLFITVMLLLFMMVMLLLLIVIYLELFMMCASGRHATTLFDAETDFKTGKSMWGHSGRNSETKSSLKRDLVEAYITEIVSLQSEEQPNQAEVDVDVGDDDSDLEDITFQRDKSSNWQVHTGGKQRGGVFNKRQAKRHMDPVLVKHLHRQYEIDMALDGTNELRIAKLTMFQETWNNVLKDMIVYIRKNKGASGICIRLLLRSFLVLKLCCFPR
jgi:hypothetical protein